MDRQSKIPKIIHYVWVGTKPLTPLAKKCILSWKMHLPEYEFRLWNESNSPMLHHYVNKMYRKKQWAFVADYIRFWALEKEGGVYLDTDTEVLKTFDPLLNHGAFFGQTKDGITAAGVIGAVARHPAISDMLAVYDADTEYSTGRTSPRTVTNVLAAKRYDDVVVYGYQYFNPCDDGEVCSSNKLSLAYTINHWAGSWVPFRRVRKLARRLGIVSFFKKISDIFNI